jgi:hypothetical protein
MRARLYEFEDRTPPHQNETTSAISRSSLWRKQMGKWLIALTVSMTPFVALADPLPEGAVKMSAAEVQKMYVGKTANWDSMNGYWSPSKQYLIMGKDKSWYGAGTWAVSGNKMCVNVPKSYSASGPGRGGGACWMWVKVGNKTYSNWNRDGKGHPKDGWWDGEAKTLKSGDRVTKQVSALKKKWGA